MPMTPAPLASDVVGLVGTLAHDGTGLAVWAHQVRTAASVAQGAVWANRGTALDGWGEPVRLSTDTESITRRPALAMDGQGNAVAAWGQQNPDAMTSFVYATFRAATRSWASPVVVGRESYLGGPDMARALAMNAPGTAILAFSETGHDISVTRITDAGASPLRTAMRNGLVSDVAVGIDAAGQAIVVWNEEGVMVARERGSGLELPVHVGGPSPTGPTRLGVLPDGRAVLVWVEGRNPHRLMGARFE